MTGLVLILYTGLTEDSMIKSQMEEEEEVDVIGMTPSAPYRTIDLGSDRDVSQRRNLEEDPLMLSGRWHLTYCLIAVSSANRHIHPFTHHMKVPPKGI
jgi:hypothetical protein